MSVNVNVFVLAVGILFVVVGAMIIIKQLKSVQKNTTSVTAEVSGYNSEDSYDNETGAYTTVYYPIMKYYVFGIWHEKQADVGDSNQKYSVGDKVNILVDPEKPDEYIIANDKTKYIVGGAMVIAGIVASVLSFTMH